MQRPLLLSLVGAALAPSSLLALGIRVPDQDPTAIARGNAFAATADNPSAIYYNPAGITQLPGHQVQVGVNMLSPRNEFTSPSGAEFDLEEEWHALPELYYTYSSRQMPLSFGLGFNAPFGLGLEWPDDTPFRRLAIEGRLKYVTANPVVAWKINDQLSVAAGVQANWGDVSLLQGGDPTAAPVGQDTIEFKGDNISVGFNAGIRWQLNDQHAFGATYRSASEMDFEGETRTTFLVPIPAFVQDASAEFQFPQSITVGYSYRPTARWNFEVNVDWTDWEALNTVQIKQAIAPVSRPFNWQSSFMYMFGASYLFDDNWTVSGGYIYSENSVPDEWFNPAVPDSDRHVFSVGVSKRFDRLNIAAAFQYSHGPTRTIASTSLPGALANGEYDPTSLSFSLSGGYRF